MTKLTLEYKRLSPNESISSFKDTKNNVKAWRHRFIIKGKAYIKQSYKDYKFEDFKDFEHFTKYIQKKSIEEY